MVIIGLIVTFFLIRSGISGNVESKLSRQFQVPVTVGSIGIGFSAIDVEKLIIDNPAGSILPKALSTVNITVSAPLTRYLKNHIVIDEISVTNIDLGLEFDSPSGPKGNWTQLMSHYEDAPEGAKQPNRTVFIKRLVLNNISVQLVYKTNSKNIRRLPLIKQIVLTDIHSSAGVPMHQIMESILGQMLKSVFLEENLKNMIEGIIKNPPATVKELFKLPFKGLFK